MNTRRIRILNALRARHAEVSLKIQALERAHPQVEDRFTSTHTVVTKPDSVEDVLLRLMVQDRARLERQPVRSLDDDLICKLNLIAFESSTTRDLRFIDALNYYYELLSPIATPGTEHSWMFVSFLQLYAQALDTLTKEIATCA